MAETYSVTASLEARDSNFTSTFEAALDVLRSLDRAVNQIATVVLKAQDNATPVIDDAIKACQQADQAASDIAEAKLDANDNMTPTVEGAVGTLEKAKSEASEGVEAELEATDNMSGPAEDAVFAVLKVQDAVGSELKAQFEAVDNISPKATKTESVISKLKGFIKSIPEMVLKGRDESLGKTADEAITKMDTLSSKIKSGIGFGALMAIGNRAVNALSNGVQGLGESFNTSSLAWKSFNGNMQILGASGDQIKSVQKDLENYAQATVYNASDMASTYAQLAAVGTKNTAQLVKGFGGLAAAAENPSQAMKTLSQQATQMAGRPTVAWQDFKLMLEQTPSGIAAVAKQMGMSTQDMVQAVQDGKIKTEDFFNAVEQVGNSDAFNNMAQNFKSVGQAMDGLYEDVTAKFMPVWDKLQDIGINAVQGIISAMDRIDVGALTAKIDGFIAGAKKSFDDFWSSFINSGAVDSLRNLFDDLGPAISNVVSSLGGASGIFSTLGSVIGTVVDKVAELADKIAQFVANMSPGQVQAFADVITGLGVAFLTIKGVSSIATKIKKIGDTAQNAVGPIKSLAGKIKSIFTKGEGASGTAEEVKKIGDNAEQSSRRVSSSVSKINAKFKGACNIIKQFGN